MTASREIRQQFIDYFVSKRAHAFVPSSPVVPHDDPTLMFANAGMNQFKPYFLGTQTPDHPRAANTQKCIRAGGKHNDLEDVGHDTYHHTFFEMLGNWSFGDYFKAEAIEWAWDLLVNVWGLAPDRLHATYFEGDESEGLAPDDEARTLWERFLPAERIHPGNKKDNFWEMGDTGPCGPCSEIHYDGTDDLSGGPLVNRDDPRVIEIWNLVFIQFNRAPAPGKGDAPGKLTPLPAKHVDTGMGFERIVRVLQGKQSNYDTDIFTPIFEAIRQVTGARPYGGGGDEKTLKDPIDIAYRVIADHVRCLTFALTDGAAPSNEGRGYVLRRILRRAVRYGWQTLGVKEPFLCRLVPAVVDAMKDAFPELARRTDHVVELVRDEEQSFGRTLDRGIALFEEAAGHGGRKQISADDAFMLHDTYGFPLDLTQLMAEERGMRVDVDGFNQLMEEAREKARAAGAHAVSGQALTSLVQDKKLPATRFVGYEMTEDESTGALRIYRVDDDGHTRLDSAEQGDEVVLVIDSTPFYAEAGGQVGDTGVIGAGGVSVRITDTQKVGDVYLHVGVVESGTLRAGEGLAITARVDLDRRRAIMANHTSTHMMNRALRKHVSESADQKGSLVDDEKLRFDFSHSKPLGDSEIEQVQQTVNADIAADLPVYAGVAPVEVGRSINGLRAVFGEKYPPSVRIVSIGVPVDKLVADPSGEDWPNYSIEFCGGTHLASTGDAEHFVIVHEEAVAKGVRRITALTGQPAHDAEAHGEKLLAQLAAAEKAQGDALAQAVADLTKQMAEHALPALVRTRLREGLTALQKAVKDQEKSRSKEAAGQVVEVARRIAEEATGPVIIAPVDGADANGLRTAMDVITKKHPDAALLLGAATDGKVAFLAAVPKPLIARGLKAGDWVKHVAQIAGGGGGGRPDMAQAGGKDPTKLEAALDAGRKFAAEKI